MFDLLKKWMGIEKKAPSTMARTIAAMTGRRPLGATQRKRRQPREQRNFRRFLLRGGRFVTRHELRCMEISGMDVLRTLVRRNDRAKYIQMKEARLLQDAAKVQTGKLVTRRQQRQARRIMRKAAKQRVYNLGLRQGMAVV